MTKVLITGGAGFIGSNYVHHALKSHLDWEIWNLDKLTYAGNLANLKSTRRLAQGARSSDRSTIQTPEWVGDPQGHSGDTRNKDRARGQSVHD